MNYIINRNRKRTLNFQSTGYNITVEGENLTEIMTELNKIQKEEEYRNLQELESFKVKIDAPLSDEREIVEKVIIVKGKHGKVKHDINGTCKKCDSPKSWDGSPYATKKENKGTRNYPLHVDENGYETDSCYEGG